MITTAYIVPAWSDQAGQCRIVAITGPLQRCAKDHYRAFPSLWREVGKISSRGRLVCLCESLPAQLIAQLQESQPLMAGTQWAYDDERKERNEI